MKFPTVRLTLLVLTMTPICNARAQSAVDKLQPLVETSAQRLMIADKVALAKSDSGAAVEDTTREGQVIASAIKEGEAKGLEQSAVSDFFKAQIEANKIVQYSLLADWRRTGAIPEHTPVNLAQTIRPELDRMQTTLIAELADTAAIRSGATCRVDVARAIGKYMTAHPHDIDTLHTIALDRSLAATCAP
jgi:chorismate mutase